MTDWPKTPEDKQLDQYWKGVGGSLYLEVTMGGKYAKDADWNGEAATRRLDGVIVHGGEKKGVFDRDVFRDDVREMNGKSVELIEAKKWLSRGVLGQSLVGEWMFKKQFAAEHSIEVKQSVVLYRHTSPAMKWVAAKLGLVAVPYLKDGKVSEELPPPAAYELLDGVLSAFGRYREKSPGGSTFTRVPLAGHDSGVEEWGPTPRVWLPFVRVLDGGPSDVRVYEADRHGALLRDASNQLELVFVVDEDLVRGHIGTIAARALMFERQYGRPFTKCTIVCKQTDPAVEEACLNTGGTRGIPPVEVVALGR